MEPLNLKETALKEDIKEILEELENMYEISELEEQVNNINKIRNYIINLLQENKQLKIQISAREEVCDRLESNWNKLKEFIVESNKTLCWTNNYDSILGKMEELQGSDNNDTNR